MWYIFRHGETLDNKRILQGRTATLLTLKGIVQAESYAYRLKENEENIKNYKFISSPIVRALHTTQIMCEICHIENIAKRIIKEDLLTEIDIGDFVGKTTDEKQEKRDTDEDFWDYKYPNGESYENVYQRMLDFVEKYKDEDNLVIVTHGRPLAFLKDILAKEPKNNIALKKENADLSQNYFYLYNQKEEILTKI
ncbi:MAG: histidine phosphatase family protein [Rickettsiales bacterium]|nr:MAG: histidine phosphatase family protein [Rickettsiales bacterium]